MILIACFQQLFFIFRIFSTPQNTISPLIFLRTFFFYKTGHLPDTKIVDKISQGISCGLRVIFNKMYWPKSGVQEIKKNIKLKTDHYLFFFQTYALGV